ncbi:Luminescence regulatory protein LuxO [Novipirellula galeiformis]|uniref:Luminescence regulatory protein LuxO n=1 Tax=Novipirellula galeiformis TaxID=2528004 RepID=A0A5C6CDT8_9BACT|nr:response regulator [Novipirellula galeiformis]TWU22428.1 Luminescence regulatory protein LuxO [Novipirellula galeiformis]
MASILLCEDSPTHTLLMQTLLEEDAHQVHCVEDGRQAIDWLADQLPELVVTDLRMPNMNGVELVRTLISDYPQIPAVVVTARGSEDLAVDALALGAVNFVPKNSLNVLLNLVVRQAVAFSGSDRFSQSFAGQLHSPEFYFKLSNSIESINPVTQIVIQALAASGKLNMTERIRIGFAVASALFNAMCYGNLELSDEDPMIGKAIAGDSASQDELLSLAKSDAFRKRSVHLKVSGGEKDTRISVSHDGQGRLARFSPAPGTPESFEFEQCRGMMLVTSFMDEVIFNSGFSEVVMVKYHDKK